MTKKHSTPAPSQIKPAKPAKPTPDFPLFAHAIGLWAKKIRGKLHYFGKWDDPDAALKKYLEQKGALHAGRTPRDDAGALTVFTLCGRFLTLKEQRVSTGELTQRSYEEYAAGCKLLISAFGRNRLVTDLHPDDFEKLRNKLAKRWGPIRLGNVIQRIRTAFKFGYDAGLMEYPMRFGPGFARPSKKTLRLEKAKRGPMLFTAEEIRRLLGLPPWRPAAGKQLSAMILLGINCGFGNADCATLPLAALDLQNGWVNYPRPKTGIARRCPLWPQTVAALRAVLASRKEPKHEPDTGLVFITKYGASWDKSGIEGTTVDNPISKETAKLLLGLGINGRKGRGFYTLRHVFQTIGDQSGDFIAVRAIMGHADSDISAHYRERISDERLKRVTEHVRGWLLPPPIL
jgi:integrase